MIDTNPIECNLCGGTVIFTSNAAVYHGGEYGSGKCYLCTECGVYVGTHKPYPTEALGLLADAPMRKGKKICHDLFDPKWKKGKNSRRRKRSALYAWLAQKLEIPVDECHIGWFDIETLRRAYKILLSIKDEDLVYDNRGKIIN